MTLQRSNKYITFVTYLVTHRTQTKVPRQSKKLKGREELNIEHILNIEELLQLFNKGLLPTTLYLVKSSH